MKVESKKEAMSGFDFIEWAAIWFATIVLVVLFITGVAVIAKTSPYLGIGLLFGVLAAVGFILHDALEKA